MTQPEKRFSAGAVVATVWQNQGKNKEGQDVAYRTVSLQRRYKDKDGNWQNASSFRTGDLPRVSLVMHKAYEFLVLKESEGSGSSNVAEEVVM
jgi:hypothetical protein